MNKLSYSIENFVENNGYEDIEFTAYFYLVDGKKLEFGTGYLPASCWEILDDDETDENHKMAILCNCSCGMWACDSYVAKIVEKETTFIDCGKLQTKNQIIFLTKVNTQQLLQK